MIEINIQKIAHLYSIKGVSLFPLIGTVRNGFYRHDAIRLINIMLTEVVPVIGIDIFLLKNNIITFTDTYDNWYCDRIMNESFSKYTLRSCANAKRYIEDYNPKGAIPVFDITIFDFKFL
jgi:hypothetical protein